MVEPVRTHGKSSDRTGSVGTRSRTGTGNATKLNAKKTTSRTALDGSGQTSVTTPDNPRYSQVLRDAVWDDGHRPAMEFVIEVCRVAKMSEESMKPWFLDLNTALYMA
jgi:hypothetical protein